MTNQELFRAIGEVREDQILEADEETAKKTPRNPARRPTAPAVKLRLGRYGTLAACLVLLLGAGPALNRTVRWMELQQNFHTATSAGTGADAGDLDGSDYSVNGQEAATPPAYSVGAEIAQLSGPRREGTSSACLSDVMWLAPEELFAQDTAIFRGTVQELQYYLVTVDGTDTYYTRALVEVTDCLRGKLGAGEVYSVLYMGAKGYEVNSLSGPLAELDAGDEAIFMPMWTSPDTGWRSGADYFCYADLAPLYLSEGMRFVFAETENGLSFSRSTYGEIASAETLDEVTAYIRTMIGEDERSQPAANPAEPQPAPSHTAQAGEPGTGPAGARELPGGATIGDE